MNDQSLDLLGQMISANVSQLAATTDSIIDYHEKRGNFGQELADRLEDFAYAQDSRKMQLQLLRLIDSAWHEVYDK